MPTPFSLDAGAGGGGGGGFHVLVGGAQTVFDEIGRLGADFGVMAARRYLCY